MSNRPSMFLRVPSRRLGNLLPAGLMRDALRAGASDDSYRRAVSEAWLMFRAGRFR